MASRGASQCEAEHRIGRIEGIRRGCAEVVSAIGIVPVPLYLCRRNGNVLSVLPAFCVDIAVKVLDFSRVAVRLIATASGRIIRHVPCRIKHLMQELILWGMVVLRTLVVFLRSDSYRQ